MKAVMYHYVRREPPGLPFFRYLHVDDFKRQLDWLQQRFPFPGWDEVRAARSAGSVPDGVVLTFDDGFMDHHEHVMPELLSRGLWGIFYIPTSPLASGKILDVHRIQLLLGRLGGVAAMDALENMIDDSMIPDQKRADFRKLTYPRQDNDEATVRFKRILNYYISYDHRGRVMDSLFDAVFGQKFRNASSLYMDENQIRDLAYNGMVIGSHGVNHLVFSKLSSPDQQSEISQSLSLLGSITGGPVETFCYPYGGSHTYTAETEEILEDNDILFTFDVDGRDVSDRDIRQRPHALPRYDCNQFPHGEARIGKAAPSLE